MVFRVALTGGIASGKSTVAALFAELGVPVIDSDVLARAVVRPGSDGLAAIEAAFGAAILSGDGTLDRAELRRRIFDNPKDKQTLEGILHPRIRAEMERRSAQAGGPYQVLEIPLLAETGQATRSDRVLVVDCEPRVQIERLMARDGSDERQAQRVLAQQATREQRLAIADDVLRNDDDIGALAPRVLQLHRKYLHMAVRPR